MLSARAHTQERHTHHSGCSTTPTISNGVFCGVACARACSAPASKPFAGRQLPPARAGSSAAAAAPAAARTPAERSRCDRCTCTPQSTLRQHPPRRPLHTAPLVQCARARARVHSQSLRLPPRLQSLAQRRVEADAVKHNRLVHTQRVLIHGGAGAAHVHGAQLQALVWRRRRRAAGGGAASATGPAGARLCRVRRESAAAVAAVHRHSRARVLWGKQLKAAAATAAGAAWSPWKISRIALSRSLLRCMCASLMVAASCVSTSCRSSFARPGSASSLYVTSEPKTQS